ncbi:MAG: hypoxanthine phosphoribosyltransferase, partial [Lachnospiraceae bacterium]|nr:hypoxanthine phosphoribosyltransferase [Lachnospiraceae bacterium]
MTEKIHVMIDEQEINVKIRDLAEKINKDYEGKALHLICILKGSAFFACDLAKHLTVPTTIDFMSISSYGSGTVSS